MQVSAPVAARDIKPWVEPVVRVGYAAKGIIYILMGVLALRLALGFAGGRATDASGVLHLLLRQPMGVVLVGIIGIGILTYATWHIAESLTNARHRPATWRGRTDRALGVLKALVYGGVGWQAMRLVLGLRDTSTNPDGYARDAMRVPLGDVLLVLIGIGIAVYGLFEIRKSWSGRFDDDLDEGRARGEVPLLLGIGRWGMGARGVILILMGTGLAQAGLEQRAANARGYAESMWTLFAQPSGRWLLAVVAAGLVCFGILQLLHARFARLA